MGDVFSGVARENVGKIKLDDVFSGVALDLKVEFHGKMKVDIFQYLRSKLARKRPLFSILLVTTFNPSFLALSV